MLAARKSTATARRQVQHGLTLNISDMPEMMPGAQPSANSVDRDRFSHRCIAMWNELQDENRQKAEERASRQAQDDVERYSQLQTMFPNLDSELVWNICQERCNIQNAVDTLLSISNETSADDCGTGIQGKEATGVCAKALGSTQSPSVTDVHPISQDDSASWPVLMDSHGWEIVNYQALEQQQDLGSAWCKTAKNAASLPIPAGKPTPSKSLKAKNNHQEPQGALSSMDRIEEDSTADDLTDYELRQIRGQMRASKLGKKAGVRKATQPANNQVEYQDEVGSQSEVSYGSSSDSPSQPSQC